MIFSRSLFPAPYPPDISFVLICRSLRMYEKKFDKGFLGNFCSFVRTSTIFRRPRLVVSSDCMHSYFIPSFTPRSSFTFLSRSNPCPLTALFLTVLSFDFFVCTQELPTHNLFISPCCYVCNFKDLFYPLLCIVCDTQRLTVKEDSL